MSLDGRTALANGASQWITAEAARADVQRWRARSSAILTGSGTLRADNPRLTVRFAEKTLALEGEGAVAPLRVVLDRELSTPQNAHVLDGSVPTLVFHAADAKPAHDGFERVERVAVESHADRLDLAQVLSVLAERGVNELQVEAGPTLCGALFAGGLADELLLYISPILLGDRAQPLLKLPGIDEIAAGRRLRVIDQRHVGDDWRLLLRE
jgi:diaminohydroxyphosphoribosylaminopyrimidine deaminase/5-amino-6-(5-phosphoribosylamino)uracil reductase